MKLTARGVAVLPTGGEVGLLGWLLGQAAKQGDLRHGGGTEDGEVVAHMGSGDEVRMLWPDVRPEGKLGYGFQREAATVCRPMRWNTVVGGVDPGLGRGQEERATRG